METKSVSAIFEAGKLLPLETLDLNEHERVELTIVRAADAIEEENSEDDYIPYIAADADPSITLEQVQAALAGIPGSLVEDFERERDERF
ncbi:MAG TPA: antitoxin family protein [Pirellulales bacterium]|jgi:predicted DNA-binding antitoxin AbrB/MazE fold protein